jgi:hypothetical protein
MSKIIEIKVEDKVASLVDRSQFVVCGNTDYEIHFEFSEEWSDEFVKTALFVFGEDVVEQVFTGNVCEGVEIVNASLCRIGVYAGNIKTTTPACLDCRKSITDAAGGKAHKDPSEDIYNQIIEVVNQGFAKIEDFEEDIDGLGNSINNLQIDVSDVFAQLDGVRDDISQNSQGISSLNQVIGWMSGDIGANSSAISQNSQKISQNTKDIAEQTKRNDITDIRLANLEHHINPDYFYTDESVAYQKLVPADAAPYAQLNSVGGMTYKSKNLVHIPDIQKGVGDNNIIDVNLTDKIYVSAEVCATTSSNIWRLELTQLNGEKWYVMDKQLQDGGVYFNKITADNPVISIKYRDTYITEGKYSKFMITYGMTRVPYEPYYEDLRDAKVTAIRNHGANLTDGITIDPSVMINKEVYRELPLILGQGTYTISFSSSVYWQSRSTNITKVTGAETSNAFVFTVNDNAPAFVRFRDATSSSTPWDYSTKIMVNRGDNALPYSPYYEQTIPLPTEITSLDGWGKGIEGYPNTYDFESGTYTKYTDDGETLLETPIIVGIPTTFDNIIAVEGGGSLEFVNEYGYDAPSSITYLLQEGSV